LQVFIRSDYMKLLRYIADKLYKYSSYAQKENKPLITQKTVDIIKINSEIKIIYEENMEILRELIARAMIKEISNFITIYKVEDKAYRGEIKVIKE